MALATRCPACETTFKVVPDQLKLHQGLVRCGQCQHIFNGLRHMVGTPEESPSREHSAAQSIAPSAAPSTIAADTDPAPLGFATTRPVISPANIQHDDPHEAAPSFLGLPEARLPLPEPAAAAIAANTPSVTPPASPSSDLQLAPNVLPPTHFAPLAQVASASLTQLFNTGATPTTDSTPTPAFDTPLTQHASELDGAATAQPAEADVAVAPAADVAHEAMPETTAEEGTVFDDVGFVQAAQARDKERRSPWRWIWRTLAVLLTATAVLQWLWWQRDWVAYQWPNTEPHLKALCAQLACGWQPPKYIESLVIEQSDLQKNPPPLTGYALSVILHNKADIALAMPAIELSLTDIQGQILSRRIFTPNEYLAGKAGDKLRLDGIPAQTELPVRLQLGLGDVALNYRVQIFYP